MLRAEIRFESDAGGSGEATVGAKHHPELGKRIANQLDGVPFDKKITMSIVITRKRI